MNDGKTLNLPKVWCINCSTAFDINKLEYPFKIKCPNCGKENDYSVFFIADIPYFGNGELKKKLFWVLQEGDDCSMEQVEKVLDEAKTELPSAMIQTGWYSNDDVAEMRRWIWKYFGEDLNNYPQI